MTKYYKICQTSKNYRWQNKPHLEYQFRPSKIMDLMPGLFQNTKHKGNKYYAANIYRQIPKIFLQTALYVSGLRQAEQTNYHKK